METTLKERMAAAKRRRSKLLAEFTKPRKEPLIVAEMARKHGVSSARMSKLLKMARADKEAGV